MILSTCRTKTNNKNNAHFKLLISSFLGGRVIAYASKIYKKDQQRTPIDVLKRAAGALRRSGKLRQSA